MNNVRQVTTLGLFLLTIALIIGGGLWYAGYLGKPQANESPIPSVKPFSEKDQVVPQGATSQKVADTLRIFNFSKPLPFFDERNVVQSLNLGVNTPTSTTSSSVSFVPKDKQVSGLGAPSSIFVDSSPTFLSYRIFGQNKEIIQKIFITYFKNMGWEMADMGEDLSLVFSSNTHQIASVTFVNVLSGDINQPAIIVALTVQ